jgi:hypothetical protein
MDGWVMDDTLPEIRRLCIAITGVAGGRAANGSAKNGSGGRLRGALIAACVSTGLHRVLLTQHQQEGDGAALVALMPVGIDEPRAVAALASALSAQLRRLNRGQSGRARIRAVMAVHEGITVLAPDGYHGQAISTARRLAAAADLGARLADNPTADLIVLLSERVFEDIDRPEAFGVPPGRFERVEIRNPPAGTRDVGWIYIPRSDPRDI